MKLLQQRVPACMAHRLSAIIAMALVLAVALVPAQARAEEMGDIEDAPSIQDVVSIEDIDGMADIEGMEGVADVEVTEKIDAPEGAEVTEGAVQTVTTSSGNELPLMGNDYVWAGESLELEGAEVPNDVLAAGRDVRVEGGKVAGSVRMAGQDVALINTTVQESVTLAGQTVSVRDSQANAVALAGQSATFSGTCAELSMFAGEVIIDGTVSGDVMVGANSVTIGEHARIEGTLRVSAPQEPVVKEGAKVSDIDYSATESGVVAFEQAGAMMSGLLAAFGVLLGIVSAVGTLVVAVCAEWLFGRHTKAAATMVRQRTGATVATGVVGTLLAPVACIVLCLLVVTFPIALAVAFALLAMGFVASGFAAASLAKLAFPRLGRYGAALAGGAIVGAAKLVPVLGSLVSTVALMYLMGYVLQSIHLGMGKNDGTAASGRPVNPSLIDD